MRPAWPDDEEEDNPLPGWVEGDSLAPYVGSDPSMLAEALDLRLADSIIWSATWAAAMVGS